MNFKELFNNYSNCCDWNLPTFLWKNEDALLGLLDLYTDDDSENEFLLKTLESFNPNDIKSRILRRNTIEVIKWIKDKISKRWKNKIIDYLVNFIFDSQINSVEYSECFWEYDLLFELEPLIVKLKKLIREDISIDWYEPLFQYCVKYNHRLLFNNLIVNYIFKFEDEVKISNRKYFYNL